MTIISHKHRFVFIAIPKTGTHSVRFALRPQLGPKDEEQVSLFVKSRLPYERFANVRHGHLAAKDLREVLGEQRWTNYRSFCVVRNPWDRFVSYCSFITRSLGTFESQPQVWMRKILNNPAHHKRILFFPQSHFVTDAKGELLVDEVCRIENLQADIDQLFAKLGLAQHTLQKLNDSKRGQYRDCYDDALKQQVSELYREDIERFQYSF